jgi:hypothetical protein
MTTTVDSAGVCGICGQPLGEHDIESGHGDVSDAGRDVEYVVIEVRGVLAFCRAVIQGTNVDRTHASVLAQNLNVSADELMGRHFVCHEVRNAYGTTQSRFRLVDVDDAAHAAS